MIENTINRLIKEFPDKEWRWAILSLNSGITFDTIQYFSTTSNSNTYRNWDWGYFSLNKNLTWDIIQSCSATSSSNPDKPWNWLSLSLNEFENDPYFKSEQYFISNVYRKIMTKRLHSTIQEELIKVACHPRRVLNWNEDVNDPNNPYYGMTQEDINYFF